MLATLAEAGADVYGFSAYIWNIADMLAYAGSLRKILPGARIVFGGPEVLFAGEEFFAENKFYDLIVATKGKDFLTKEELEKLGYSPCKSCIG